MAIRQSDGHSDDVAREVTATDDGQLISYSLLGGEFLLKRRWENKFTEQVVKSDALYYRVYKEGEAVSSGELSDAQLLATNRSNDG